MAAELFPVCCRVTFQQRDIPKYSEVVENSSDHHWPVLYLYSKECTALPLPKGPETIPSTAAPVPFWKQIVKLPSPVNNKDRSCSFYFEENAKKIQHQKKPNFDRGVPKERKKACKLAIKKRKIWSSFKSFLSWLRTVWLESNCNFSRKLHWSNLQMPWKCSLESSEFQRWLSETSPYQGIGQTLLFHQIMYLL